MCCFEKKAAFLLLLSFLQVVYVSCDAGENLARPYDNLEPSSDDNLEMERLLTDMYLNDMIKNINQEAYESQKSLKSHFADYLSNLNAEVSNQKRFSEFLGGKKRFSEFLGGKKRFSEFLGGKKRFSEFLGGKKRYSQSLLGMKRFSEFLGGKRASRSIAIDSTPQKRDLDFLGGR